MRRDEFGDATLFAFALGWLLIWMGLYQGDAGGLLGIRAGVLGLFRLAPLLVGVAGLVLASRRLLHGVVGVGPLELMCLYALVGLAATLWGPASSSDGLYYGLAYLAVPLFLLGARGPGDSVPRWNFFVQLNILACIGLAVGFLAVAVATGDLMDFLQGTNGRLFGSRPEQLGFLWATANGVGRFATVVGLAALVALLGGSKRNRLPWLAALMVSLLLLGMTVSRSAWFGFAVGALVVVALQRGRRVAVGATAAGILLLTATGSLGFVADYLARGQGVEDLLSFSGRATAWREALALLPGSPLFGFGFQADRLLVGEHLHNAWLQALFQAGLVGSAFFVAAWALAWLGLARLGLRARFASTGASRETLVLCAAILVFLTIRSLVESTGAFFGVDLLLLAPVFAFVHNLAERRRVEARAQREQGPIGRPRVLLGAYAFAPPDTPTSRGGEDLLGWSLARQAARRADVWVLTSRACEGPVRAAIPETSESRIRVVFVDLPRAIWWMRRRQGFVQAYAYMWQVRATFTAARLHRRLRFDLYHHLTYANDWMASHIGALLRIPFVRGPGGGAHRVPRSFTAGRGLRFRVAQALRRIAQVVFRMDPFFLLGQARAKALLVCNDEARWALPRRWVAKATLFPVNGVETEEVAPSATLGSGDRFVVMTAARLVSIKAVDLALRAFGAMVRETQANAELHVVGEGPEEPRLRALAVQLGIAPRVRWLGWSPRSDVLGMMRACDVFLFPSLRDGGGAVVVEAMAQGKPVVCLDLAGPGFHVTADCGVKVPARDPDQAVRDMASALVRLHRNPSLRLQLGEAARRRVLEEYVWDRLGERLAAVYDAATTRPGAVKGQPGAVPA